MLEPFSKFTNKYPFVLGASYDGKSSCQPGVLHNIAAAHALLCGQDAQIYAWLRDITLAFLNYIPLAFFWGFIIHHRLDSIDKKKVKNSNESILN